VHPANTPAWTHALQIFVPVSQLSKEQQEHAEEKKLKQLEQEPQ